MANGNGENGSAPFDPKRLGAAGAVALVAGLIAGILLYLPWDTIWDMGLRRMAARLPGVRLQPGNHVVELVSANHDKGAAVTALMSAAPFAGRYPVFVGDDLTDEYGFAAATRLGGYGILVGDRSPTQARHALPDVAAMHDWLRAGAA